MYRPGSRVRTSFPNVPLRRRAVRKIAKLAEVDLKGIRIKIVKGTRGTGFKGYTRNRRCIELYEDAFSTPEDLANTLGHERCHVVDLRSAGTDRFTNSLQVIESEQAARIAGLEARQKYIQNRMRGGT